MNLVLEQLPILLIVVPLVGVPVVFFVDRTGHGTLSVTLAIVIATLVLVGLALPVALQSPVETAASGWPADLGIHLRFDTLSSLAILISGLVVVAATVLPPEHASLHQYHSLLLLLFAGSNGLMVTQDLFNAYVFIEITSIASYALVAQKQNPGAFESSFKYVVMGTLAGLLILWGVAGLYLTTGSLDLANVSHTFDSVPGAVPALAVTAIIAGILMKLGQVPFHPWKADSLSGASYSASATLSGVTTTAFFVLMLRVLAAFPAVAGDLAAVLSLVAGLSILVGHFMALRQTDYSRLLAYSSVAHIGYGLLAASTGSRVAVAAGLFHVLVHAIMKSGLFLFGPVILQRVRPLRLAVYSILAMSMIGIPPVLGFTSKWYTILETALAGAWLGAVLIAIGGAIALVYYLRIGVRFSTMNQDSHEPAQSGRLQTAVPASAALILIVLAFFSDTLLGLCMQAVDQLARAVW